MTPTSPYTQLKPVLISICCPCPPLMIMMRRRRRRKQWWHATGPWNHLFFPVEPHPHSGFACKQLLLLQHLPFPKGRCIRQVFWADHVPIFPDICEFALINQKNIGFAGHLISGSLLFGFFFIEKKGFLSCTVQNVPVTAFDTLVPHLPQNNVLRSTWYSIRREYVHRYIVGAAIPSTAA